MQEDQTGHQLHGCCPGRRYGRDRQDPSRAGTAGGKEDSPGGEDAEAAARDLADVSEDMPGGEGRRESVARQTGEGVPAEDEVRNNSIV